MRRKKIIDPDGFIICRTCAVTFSRTLEYFHRNARDSYGMTRICKLCDNTRRSTKEKSKAYHNYPRRCKTCNDFFYTSLAALNKVKRLHKHYKNGCSYCSIQCVPHNPDGTRKFGVKSWDGRRRGSKNPNAILDESKVIEIRKALIKGDSNVSLANVYGVKQALISNIKHYRTWKHVSIT